MRANYKAAYTLFLFKHQTSVFQQKMFLLISLKVSGQKKIVPMKWVNNLNLADLLNQGVILYKKKEHLVYISCDVNDEPDFTLEIFDAIENGQPALYRAFVKKCFGKIFIYQFETNKIINMNVDCLDSYESAMRYCAVYHPGVLDERNQNGGGDFYGLDEEDIERIQEILAESDDENSADDDVQILFDNENDFPMPMKLTRKELN